MGVLGLDVVIILHCWHNLEQYREQCSTYPETKTAATHDQYSTPETKKTATHDQYSTPETKKTATHDQYSTPETKTTTALLLCNLVLI